VCCRPSWNNVGPGGLSFAAYSRSGGRMHTKKSCRTLIYLMVSDRGCPWYGLDAIPVGVRVEAAGGVIIGLFSYLGKSDCLRTAPLAQSQSGGASPGARGCIAPGL
jgi:hypothetical protein